MFELSKKVMRKEIEVTGDYEPQEGDQVILPGGEIAGHRAWISFRAYARALGKVSRVVEVPEPPEGYVVKEFAAGTELPIGSLYLNSENGEWVRRFFCVYAIAGFTYAIPAPEPVQQETSKLPGIEGVVVGVGIASLTVACRLTESMQFAHGQPVLVIPKVERT
jgi:hypothetical protein